MYSLLRGPFSPAALGVFVWKIWMWRRRRRRSS
jgi:hypothetical protein